MSGLVKGGPTGQGWSTWGQFMTCPTLYAYHRYNLLCSTSKARTFGSAIHLALSHHYARVRARQRGEDPDVFFRPREAILRALQFGELPDMDVDERHRLDGVLAAILPQKEAEPFEILEVEQPMAVEIGTYDLPGLPMHGQPIVFMPRIDLVTRDKRGKVWVWDHKTSSYEPDRIAEAFRLHGQFHAMRFVGDTWYGPEMGGVRLHVIKTRIPYTSSFPALPPAPHACALIQDRMLAAAHLRAKLEYATDTGRLTPFDWPAALSETTCYTRYGPCEGAELCAWGKAALEAGKQKS